MKPMLARAVDELPNVPGYIYEIKLDGQRTVAIVTRSSLRLLTRSSQEVTAKYPELADLRKQIHARSVLLDGEIVALVDGIPSFQRLQLRINLQGAAAVQKAMSEIPVIYYVFDLLEMNGKSLVNTPLLERRKLLEKTVKPSETVKILPYFDSRDFTVKKAKEFGYEGVIAKRAGSSYTPGKRTDSWLKQKFTNTESAIVIGWMEGGRAGYFGALLMAKYSGSNLRYVGRVGTGFNERNLALLRKEFDRRPANSSPVKPAPKAPQKVHWLKPELVAEIKFAHWTSGGILRSPVFISLRNDIKPDECRM